MPTQEEETTFTLSLGGVEFTLAPTVGNEAGPAADNVMSVSTIGDSEVLINLNHFVGTLRVRNRKAVADAATSSRIDMPATENLVQNEKNEDAMSTVDVDALSPQSQIGGVDAAAPAPVAAPNPVEDTPSPPAKSCAEANEKPLVEKLKQRKGQQKGQQKLNFFGKHGKKNYKKKEVCCCI